MYTAVRPLSGGAWFGGPYADSLTAKPPPTGPCNPVSTRSHATSIDEWLCVSNTDGRGPATVCGFLDLKWLHVRAPLEQNGVCPGGRGDSVTHFICDDLLSDCFFFLPFVCMSVCFLSFTPLSLCRYLYLSLSVSLLSVSLSVCLPVCL